MILDDENLNRIKKIGFSRIPVSFTKDQTSIFGVLLTKSLVGYEACNETLKEAIMNDHIRVIVPLFFTETTNMSEVCRAFKEGHCHMGIVCDSADSARNNRNFADRVMQKLSKNQEYDANAEEID